MLPGDTAKKTGPAKRGRLSSHVEIGQ